MVIDRYILKEIFFTLVVVLFVLLAIFLSNRFVRFLADASAGDLASDVVLSMLALKTLSAMVIILPLGLFMSILLGLSRLYKDSEMIALAACGVSVRRIYRSVIMLALAVAGLVAVIALYISPWAEEQSYKIRDTQSSQPLPSGLGAGRFAEPGGGNGVLYYEEATEGGTVLHQVFIEQRHRKGEVVLSAQRGKQWRDENGEQYLVLIDGYRYEGEPGKAGFRIIKFHEHAIRIAQKDTSPSFRKQRARPTRELIGSEKDADIAELQWRVSMPLSVLFLSLLAVPLSRTSPRQGKYSKLFIAVMIYLIYSNILAVANSWVTHSVLPPQVGMWWVHVAMLISTWILFIRQYGMRWVLRAMFGKRVVS